MMRASTCNTPVSEEVLRRKEELHVKWIEIVEAGIEALEEKARHKKDQK